MTKIFKTSFSDKEISAGKTLPKPLPDEAEKFT